MATSLVNLETVQHQFAVTPQVHTSCSNEGCADVAELIDTGDDACEHACLRVVVVLFIVDDLVEMNDCL